MIKCKLRVILAGFKLLVISLFAITFIFCTRAWINWSQDHCCKIAAFSPVLFSFKVFCLSCPSWRANIYICLCGRFTECCRVWCTLGKSYSVAPTSFTGKGIYSIRYKSSVITTQVTNIKKVIATIAEAVIFLIFI